MSPADLDQGRRQNWSLQQWEEGKPTLVVLASARRFVDMVTTASSAGHESTVVDDKRSIQDTQKAVQRSPRKEREWTRKEDQRIDCGGESDVRDRCHSAAVILLFRESALRQHDKVEQEHGNQDRQRSSSRLLQRQHEGAADHATVGHQKDGDRIQRIGHARLVVFVYASAPAMRMAA
jgi:hypothetical protein